jgi:uncharacterized coiled-coil protein SlyX
MPEISDDTKVTVPLRNLIGLSAALVIATAAYVTLNSRITQLEHGQSIQDMTIQENYAFVREWPLGLRGALPDDLIQNAKIMALEEQTLEVRELRTKINELEIQTGQCRSGVR